MIDLQGKRVWVPGGTSMIGRAIVDSLKKREANILSTGTLYYDLLDKSNAEQIVFGWKPDYIAYAAGFNGNIQFSQKYPAEIFYKTAMMALNVLHAAEQGGVKKVVSILSSCSYPDDPSGFLKEGTLWEGKPHDTIECHGLSKRVLDAYSRQLYKQYGMNAVSVVLTNCYGPNDNYNIDKTKVVGGLIKKFVEAKRNNLSFVECWGTGAPLREFMFAPDAGEAIVQALERHENPLEPLNIGSGEEISIRGLVDVIRDSVAFGGEVRWLTEKPDGQMRKMLDTTHMRELLNVPITPLKDGIKLTVEDYILRNP